MPSQGWKDKRVVFEEKMSSLQDTLNQMGGLVEEAIAKSVVALKEQDTEKAKMVISGDDIIDSTRTKMEEKCMEIIATQQPMAGDLRRVLAFFKIASDLERMGDYASRIAKITIRIGTEPLIKPLVDIPHMALLVQKMVKNSLDAFVREDIPLASSLAREDDDVDKLHAQIFRELLTVMMEKPSTISQASHLLFVSSSLERIADHATNVGEELIFLITGEQKSLND